MKTIKPVEVLLYYDGIQVFEGRDPIGGHYIAALLDTVGEVDRYLATGAKPERLRQFRVGELSLRDLILDAPGGEWFFIDADAEYGESLTLIPQKGALAEQEDLLPGHFMMRDALFEEDLAPTHVYESNNTFLEFSLDPPETAYGHRIRADALGDILTQFQIVVKHAYHRATNRPYRKVSGYLSKFDIDAGYLLDVVVPAAPGSFRVILEAAVPLDGQDIPLSSGSDELARSLELVDEVFQSAKRPDIAHEILLRHKGHLAKSYIKLLGILAERNTSFNYSWSDPQMGGSHYGGVDALVAQELYETLSERFGVYLGKRARRVIEGAFVRMDIESDAWGLRSRRGIRKGKIRDDGPSLQRLVPGELYRFYCTDEVELDAIGRGKHTLYLDSIVPLSERAVARINDARNP